MAVELHQQRRATELGFPEGTGKQYGESDIQAFLASPFPKEPFRGKILDAGQKAVLKDQARSDFAEAVTLTQRVDRKSSIFHLTDIAITQAKVRFEPVMTGAQILVLAGESDLGQKYQPTKTALVARAANLFMASGDTDRALEIAQQEFHYLTDYTRLLDVLSQADLTADKKGQVIEATLDVIKSQSDRLRGFGNGDFPGFALDSRLNAGLIVEQSEIDELAANSSIDSAHSRYWVNLDLAQKYIKAGFPERALERWRMIPELPEFTNRTETLSEIAIVFADRGQDPGEIITQAKDLTDNFQGRFADHTYDHRSEVYANLAVAQYKFNGLREEYIDHALVDARKKGSNLRTNTLITVAEAQNQMGMDPSEALKESLDWADDFSAEYPANSRRADSYGIDLLTYGDVAQAYTKMKFFNGARVVLSTLDLYRDEENLIDQCPADEKIRGLTYLAEKEARTSVA